MYSHVFCVEVRKILYFCNLKKATISMAITDKQLIADLSAGKYKPVYLLTGEENYYIDVVSDYFEENVIDPSVRDFDFDLSNVSYIASAGLRVLVMASKLADKRGGTMRLLHPVDEVMDILEMTGLTEVFSIER